MTARTYAEGEHTHVSAPSQIADPTGVGDMQAGLLKGIACGFNWTLCGQIGALAASYVLEHVGTQNHHYTLAEFVSRFRTVFDDRGALDAWLA